MSSTFESIDHRGIHAYNKLNFTQDDNVNLADTINSYLKRKSYIKRDDNNSLLEVTKRHIDRSAP
jgi:hypothetical protein